MIQRLRTLALVTLLACIEVLYVAGTAEAQLPASARRVGVLLVGFSPNGGQAQAFREGLRSAGYTEGRDVVIEWYSAHADYDRVAELGG